MGSELYGTTEGGGTHGASGGDGIVFEVSTSGTESVLHNFGSGHDGAFPEGGLTAVGSELYGTTLEGGAYGTSGTSGGDGTVFEVSKSGKESVLHSFGSGTDGAAPFASLFAVGSELYGTTRGGGNTKCKSGCGTVFELTP